MLLENEKEHLSAEEIFFLVKKESGIGLATVYRTLEILTELKIVDKVSFNDGLARYDLRRRQTFPSSFTMLELRHDREVEEDLYLKWSK